eukprot:g3977.t1
MNRQVSSLTRSLKASDHRATEAEHQLVNLKKRFQTSVQNSQASLKNMKAKLSHAEHQLRAKETIIGKLKDQLRLSVSKSKEQKESDTRMFENLRQRKPRKGSVSDQKQLDIIAVYERMRKDLEEQNMDLRSQVRTLANDLRIATNNPVDADVLQGNNAEGTSKLSSRFKRSQSKQQAASTNRAGQLLSRIEQSKRSTADTMKRIHEREADIIARMSRLEGQLDDAGEQIAELQEENTNLQMALESRPTIRQWREAQRRIKNLTEECGLKDEKLERYGLPNRRRDGRSRGGTGNHRGYPNETNDIYSNVERFANTREMIRQDKADHRLKLTRIDQLPTKIVRQVLRAVCRELNLTDVAVIVPALKKMQKVIMAVPRMETFIKQISSFVFLNTTQQQQQQNSNERKTNQEQKGHNLREAIDNVIPTLQEWLIKLQRMEELQRFRIRIGKIVAKRQSNKMSKIVPQTPADQFADEMKRNQAETSMDNDTIVNIVEGLVRLEKETFNQREVFDLGDDLLVNKPTIVINRIVNHFKELFDVKHLEGVFPKMNELYLFVTSSKAFRHSLAELLALQPDVSYDVLISVVRKLKYLVPRENRRVPQTASSNPKSSKAAGGGLSRPSSDIIDTTRSITSTGGIALNKENNINYVVTKRL